MNDGAAVVALVEVSDGCIQVLGSLPRVLAPRCGGGDFDRIEDGLERRGPFNHGSGIGGVRHGFEVPTFSGISTISSRWGSSTVEEGSDPIPLTSLLVAQPRGRCRERVRSG